MKIKLLGVLAAVSMFAACGDDTTGGGGTGGTGGTPEGGSPSAGAPEGGSMNVTGGAPEGGAPEGGAPPDACAEKFPDGAALAATLVITNCGCVKGAPCATECDGAEVCTTPGPTTEDEDCGDCVQAQADKQADCAFDAATGPECQGDPDCQGYINCVLTGG